MRFVIQKHAASHLHYDFRLEIDGVLVSWAIPKELSNDSKIKRLAVKVSDHTLSYINFEGTIAKGNYGAGSVMVWDSGTYEVEGNDKPSRTRGLIRQQLKDGSIKIILNGEKLKGSWHLFKLNGSNVNWLIKKGTDEFSNKDTKFHDRSVLTNRRIEQIK